MVVPLPPFPVPDFWSTPEPASRWDMEEPGSRWEDCKNPRDRSACLHPFAGSLERWLDLNA